MRYRVLGRSGLQVSEIGYGAWGIGKSEWIGAEDEQSLSSLKTARDLGVNFFDTALAYGMGHSEQLLARAFGNSPEVIIASKVPPKNLVWPAKPHTPLHEVFPKSYVLESLDQSLRNLKRERVDIYQFHVWTDEWASQQEWLETVAEMRASGKARFIGVSINDHEPANSLRALETGVLDTVQIIYNIFDQSPEDELFPYCREHGIGVIARVPFDEGSLTGHIRPDTKFAPGDFRNEYFGGDRKHQVWEHVQGLIDATKTRLEDLPELALRFCLSAPEVSTVIPGMRNANHVASNCAASNAGPLDAMTLRNIRPQRWIRNFYD